MDWRLELEHGGRAVGEEVRGVIARLGERGLGEKDGGSILSLAKPGSKATEETELLFTGGETLAIGLGGALGHFAKL